MNANQGQTVDTLEIRKEITIKAPIELTFEALLEEIGPESQMLDGKPMPLTLEAWPGGRWFRDLGDNSGHLWGHVQAIKRPTLLEFTGPLFASYPLVSNVQYRLTEAGGVTKIAFRHTALGFIQDEHKGGVVNGWASMLERIRKAAENKLHTPSKAGNITQNRRSKCVQYAWQPRRGSPPPQSPPAA